ncbi:MAG TPA: hypothetical protein VGI81_02850 [Tepidisphaeraceae bacterium]|jgi:hypothetical protein
MVRRLFTVACMLSLLLCISAVGLRARQGRVVGNRHEIFSFYLKSRHARYTLRGDADRLVLCAPPLAVVHYPWPYWIPADAMKDPRPVPTLLALMRNEDIDWDLMHYSDQKPGDEELKVNHSYHYGDDTAGRYNRLTFTDEGLLHPGLLDALEDPRRAVAAHVFLATHPMNGNWTLPRRPTGPFTFEFDGMKVDCAPVGEPIQGGSAGGLVDDYNVASWHVDPSQFPALRAQWHARLDRPVVTLPYSRAAVATAILPALWLAAWLRRRALLRRRRFENLCRTCGYDLRASRERCPECGTPITPKPDGIIA